MSVKADIISKGGDISLVKDQGPIETKKEKDFCKVWPQAKLALSILKEKVKNPVVKVVISTVEAAGDVLAASICN